MRRDNNDLRIPMRRESQKSPRRDNDLRIHLRRDNKVDRELEHELSGVENITDVTDSDHELSGVE